VELFSSDFFGADKLPDEVIATFIRVELVPIRDLPEGVAEVRDQIGLTREFLLDQPLEVIFVEGRVVAAGLPDVIIAGFRSVEHFRMHCSTSPAFPGLIAESMLVATTKSKLEQTCPLMSGRLSMDVQLIAIGIQFMFHWVLGGFPMDSRWAVDRFDSKLVFIGRSVDSRKIPDGISKFHLMCIG